MDPTPEIDPEQLLIKCGLLGKWSLDSFRGGLRPAIESEGLSLGSVRQHGDCVRFTVSFPPGRRPSAKPKMRMAVHRMLRRTGYRVRDRSLWMKIASRGQALVIIAAPDWEHSE